MNWTLLIFHTSAPLSRNSCNTDPQRGVTGTLPLRGGQTGLQQIPLWKCQKNVGVILFSEVKNCDSGVDSGLFMTQFSAVRSATLEKKMRRL